MGGNAQQLFTIRVEEDIRKMISIIMLTEKSEGTKYLVRMSGVCIPVSM